MKRDLTDKKYGRLTVIAFSHQNNKKQSYWVCKCECGNITIIRGDSLLNGNTYSCGCYKRQRIKETNKKYSTFDLSGEYGIGYTIDGNIFYFDLGDYIRIKDFCWYQDPDGYILTCIGKNKNIRMHRYLLNAKEEFDVDHKSGETWDNRRINLRICTRTNNNMNRTLQKNNTSGVTGVKFHKPTNKWQVGIQLNNKQIYLGLFESFDEAVAVRKQAEEIYFGEWSFDNSRNGEVTNVFTTQP